MTIYTIFTKSIKPPRCAAAAVDGGPPLRAAVAGDRAAFAVFWLSSRRAARMPCLHAAAVAARSTGCARAGGRETFAGACGLRPVVSAWATAEGAPIPGRRRQSVFPRPRAALAVFCIWGPEMLRATCAGVAVGAAAPASPGVECARTRFAGPCPLCALVLRVAVRLAAAGAGGRAWSDAPCARAVLAAAWVSRPAACAATHMATPSVGAQSRAPAVANVRPLLDGCCALGPLASARGGERAASAGGVPSASGFARRRPTLLGCCGLEPAASCSGSARAACATGMPTAPALARARQALAGSCGCSPPALRMPSAPTASIGAGPAAWALAEANAATAASWGLESCALPAGSAAAVPVGAPLRAPGVPGPQARLFGSCDLDRPASAMRASAAAPGAARRSGPGVARAHAPMDGFCGSGSAAPRADSEPIISYDIRR